MNKVKKERLVNYRRWLYQAELNETKLVAYNCPKCLEKLQTTEAPEGETWDTFSNCPFCGSLLSKVTQGFNVKIELILKIGKKEPAEQTEADHPEIPPASCPRCGTISDRPDGVHYCHSRNK
jgi:ssDNA-binding Zn-finger/Zn-ribbon topoisomerase 1